ncbi:MAG TPA: luciferase family protein [Micromonosporaceae bacterium]|jgi:Family of unknown function (DUF5519)
MTAHEMDDRPLRDTLAEIDGVVESPSMFKDDDGYWVNGKEIAHFEEPGSLGVRLTRPEIRAAKALFTGDGPARRRAPSSDWVVIDVGTPEGIDLALSLARKAAAVHAPPDGAAAAPPPTGSRLASLRRFH